VAASVGCGRLWPAAVGGGAQRAFGDLLTSDSLSESLYLYSSDSLSLSLLLPPPDGSPGPLHREQEHSGPPVVGVWCLSLLMAVFQHVVWMGWTGNDMRTLGWPSLEGIAASYSTCCAQSVVSSSI